MKLCLAILSIVVLIIIPMSAPVRGQAGEDPALHQAGPLQVAGTNSEDDLIGAARDYRASLEKLVTILERQVRYANRLVEHRKHLYAQNQISKFELDVSQQELAQAQEQMEAAREAIVETDLLIVEALNADWWDKLSSRSEDPSRVTARVIRVSGRVGWSLAELEGIETFYVTAFGKELPVSARGQTATHDRLGFDHRQAVDIAVHPDSLEGKTLINYLREAGLPFIAFRQAISGSATGAHIHIGRPSRKKD